MTGGAFGSLLAQWFHLSAAGRKTLLVAGAAAGMSAVFAAPVAATLLAVELLLFEWRPRSFIPVSVASVTGSVLRIPLLGLGPILPVHGHGPLGAPAIFLAFAIGIIGRFRIADRVGVLFRRRLSKTAGTLTVVAAHWSSIRRNWGLDRSKSSWCRL